MALRTVMSDKQLRAAVKTAAIRGGQIAVQALGKSRARRQKRGAWYFGKRVGIPARRKQQTNAPVRQLATTTTTSVVPNAGMRVRNMQVAQNLSSVGTENVATIYTSAAFFANGFGVCLDAVINPAEPSVFPSLSAISNQYQRFRTRALKFTFTPSASTQMNGSVYLAFAPQADAAQPQSVMDMQGMFATQQAPLYGSSTSLVVPLQALQQAYNVQQVEKVEDQDGDSTPLNSSGRFFFAIDGLAVADQGKNVGTVTCSYAYTFSTKRLKQGSNTLYANYLFAGVCAGRLQLTAAHLESGYHMLVDDDRFECAILRSPRSHLLISYHCEASTTPALLKLTTSFDGTTWTTQDPLEVADAATNHSAGSWRIAHAPYVRITSSNDTDQLTLRLNVASLE